MKSVGTKRPTQKRKIKFQNRVTKEGEVRRKEIKTKMKIKEDEELQENLQEEFDQEKNVKIKMWLSVIAIGIGIIGMIATTVPKNNNETKRTVKYNLSCLTASTKKPLNRCKITIVNRH